jgi:hypothetical protein
VSVSNASFPLSAVGDPTHIELLRRWGKEAHGYTREQVLKAAGDLILNALRQSFIDKAPAEQELAHTIRWLTEGLNEAYDSAGRRHETRIVLPPLKDLLELSSGR